MEEAVWIAIGVITLVLAIGIFISLFSHYQQGMRSERLPQAIAQLQAQCDLVCKAPQDTMLAVDVILPSGALLTAKDDKVCGSYDGAVTCQRCACQLEEKTVLDLTGNETRNLFKEHTFTCAVLNNGTIDITCEG